jgi:hypothetical protein
MTPLKAGKSFVDKSVVSKNLAARRNDVIFSSLMLFVSKLWRLRRGLEPER